MRVRAAAGHHTCPRRAAFCKVFRLQFQTLSLKYWNPCAGEKQLYTVLEQQAASAGQGLMGSDHTYVVPGGGEKAAGGARRPQLDARKRCGPDP